jgi:aldose sugar dehydrogenase
MKMPRNLITWVGIIGWMCISVPVQAQRWNIPEQLETRDYVIDVEILDYGLNTPWSIRFIDSETALVTEKVGRLRMIRSGEISPPIRGTPEVVPAGQGGLMDVALDPQYGENGWIYLGYTHGLEGTSGREARTMTRIVRGRIREGEWVEQEVLFEAKPEHYPRGGVHFGCRIVFDREGRLYFSIGERGRKDDAQDLSLPNGKVHRINRDGSIPSDNPFVGRPDVYESIFTYGNRNPQGLAFHPETDELWSTEHGPRGGDELNLLEAGLNYGWPVITYGINYDGTPISDLTHKEGMEQPVRQWTPSIAVCGLDFYRGELFEKWENHLLVGALAYGEMRRIALKGREVADEEIVLKIAGRVRDVRTGPDGAIYLVLNSPDVILRLTPKER